MMVTSKIVSVGVEVFPNIVLVFPRQAAQVRRVCTEDNLLRYEVIVLPEFVAIH